MPRRAARTARWPAGCARPPRRWRNRRCRRLPPRHGPAGTSGSRGSGVPSVSMNMARPVADFLPRWRAAPPLATGSAPGFSRSGDLVGCGPGGDTHIMAHTAPISSRASHSLYLQVLAAVVIGALLGAYDPGLAVQMQPLGDGVRQARAHDDRADHLHHRRGRHRQAARHRRGRAHRPEGDRLFRGDDHHRHADRPDRRPSRATRAPGSTRIRRRWTRSAGGAIHRTPRIRAWRRSCSASSPTPSSAPSPRATSCRCCSSRCCSASAWRASASAAAP